MTAVTAGGRAAGGRRGLRRASLTAMAWVIWRQHRTTLIWLGGLLLVIGIGRTRWAVATLGLLGATVAAAVCLPPPRCWRSRSASWPAC